MLFVISAKVIGLGDIFLIIYHLLLSTTEIDSKPRIENQVINGGTTMANIVTHIPIIVHKKTMGKRLLRRTPRKKRDFVKIVDKCCNFLAKPTTSTCTPFFIRRSKKAHRKTTRLKIPMLLSTEKVADVSPNETNLQIQDKSKIKKFFLKHTLTTLSKMEDSDVNKNKILNLTTKSPSTLEYPSENIMHDENCSVELLISTISTTISENCSNNLTSTEINNKTPGEEENVLNSEINANHLTKRPFTHRAFFNSSLKLQGQSLKRSTISLIPTMNKPNLTTTRSKLKDVFRKLDPKNIFHLKNKANLSTHNKLDEIKNVAPGNVSENYKTMFVSHPMHHKSIEKNVRYHQQNNLIKSKTCLNKTNQSRKMFHVHHQRNGFSTKFFSNKPIECNSTNSIILYKTTDILETQIPPFRSLHMKNKDEIEHKRPYSTSTLGINRKNLLLWNMLLRPHQTILGNGINSSVSDKVMTLKLNTIDSNLESESNISHVLFSDRGLVTKSYHHHGKCITQPLNLENQTNCNSLSNHSILASKVSQKYAFGDKFSKTKFNSKINLVNESKTKENKETISHNPFKIKYLMQFKGPLPSTQNAYNCPSLLGKIKEIGNEKTESFCNEHVPPVEISTKPVDVEDRFTNYTPTNSPDNCGVERNDHLLNTKSLYDSTYACNREENESYRDKHEHNINPSSTEQMMETKKGFNLKDIVGFRKHKVHNSNKSKIHKHNTVHPLNCKIRESHEQFNCYNSTTEDNFKDVSVFHSNGARFRDWFFGKTKKPVKVDNRKNKEYTFRWCVKHTFEGSSSVSETDLSSTIPITHKPEAQPKSSEMFSSYSQGKKLKKLFHFKTSQIYESNSTTPVSLIITREVPITKNTDSKKTEGNAFTDLYRTNSKHENLELTTAQSFTKIHNHLEFTSLKPNLILYSSFKPNMAVKVFGRGKIKQLFHRFHTRSMHALNTTYTMQMPDKNSSKKENDTVVLNPEYADYIEHRVQTKKRKKFLNRTLIHNAFDVNDTSFNIMAYVMKPLDSIVGVFKALSPNSVTRIGVVNASDIKNGSLPSHLQPPNSSIVILAFNSSNTTSKDVHESKLGMALDLLGGMYHCVFNSFVEARPEDIHFYLYTRKSPEEPEELFLPQETLEWNITNTDIPKPILKDDIILKSVLDKRDVEADEDDYEDYEFEGLNPAKSDIQSKWFNVRAETKILIHGYLQDHLTDIMVSMREAYLARGPYNVVVVDWSVLVGDSSCYPVVASRGLRQVGSLLAQLLNKLAEAGVSTNSIHIVGFSLGAHVAGHAGSFLNHGLVSRITGLDPALPYVPMEPDVSLDSDDASFVDIIHSAAGLLGQSGPMGHVDFYPNGGSQQPGCEVSSFSCSHRRAALYFIESISSDTRFQATKCESWHHFQTDNCSYADKAFMGEPCLISTRGKYYLHTGYRTPFAQPKEHVKVKKSLWLDFFYDSEDL